MKHSNFSMGWNKDYPDLRDYTPLTLSIPDKTAANGENSSVKNMLGKLNSINPQIILPGTVDLRQWCSPVEDQGNIGSCTANAAIAVLEYYEKRAFGKYLDGSRLFTYKTTRNILGLSGDTGAYLRSTMASMAMFGVALEQYYPYNVNNFDNEPSSFVYAMAQNFKALTYYRLDPLGAKTVEVLESLKKHLANGIPSMFGFTCYSSLNSASNGKIPYPQMTEKVIGGHAVAVVGYDDAMVISNGTISTTGALLIKNSWGTEWGLDGYGYLPYEYVLRGLAADFWVLISSQWIDTGNFGI